MRAFEIIKEEKIIIKWEGEISIFKISHLSDNNGDFRNMFIEGDISIFIPAFYEYLMNHPELNKYMICIAPDMMLITSDYKYHSGLRLTSDILYKAIINKYSPKTPEEKLLCELEDF